MATFHRKILRVDLTQREIWVEKRDESFYRKYVGGRGLILYYLLNETPKEIDPMGPENLLIFSSGILTGTELMGTGRNSVGCKSPLTGALASSEVGGFWGVELKRTGFDAIVFRGKADKPVYLLVVDGKAELKDATEVWGHTTADAMDKIKDE